MPADLYADLGVPKDASKDDVKRAYRRRAKEVHPDQGGDREKFERVQQAYDVLSDPVRRLTYDETGATDKRRPVEDDARALELIVSILDGFIAIDHPALLTQDLVKAMADQLAKQREQTIAAMVGMAGEIDRVKRLAARFKRKAKAKRQGPDFIAAVFEGKIKHGLSVQKQAEDSLKNIEKAIVIVSDYSFVRDDMSAAGLGGMMMRSGSSFFSTGGTV